MEANSADARNEQLQLNKIESKAVGQIKQNGYPREVQNEVEEPDVKSISMAKSRITLSTFGNGKSDLDMAIEQVEKDHFLYRRGSTQVHVQAYAGSSSSVIGSEDENVYFRGMKLVSVLLGIILFIITLSIKMSVAITEKASSSAVDEYMLTLYVCGTVWTCYYILKGLFRNKDQLKFLKSSQKSNRWLKGVIVLFGLGILLKNGLSFISYMMVDLYKCSYNNTKIAIAVFQTIFIMCQTKYIFQYSKVFIRSHYNGSRTGLMVIIAINLSTWLSAVIDETLHALHLGEESHSEDGISSYPSPSYNSSDVAMFDVRAGAPDTDGDPACTCANDFCTVATIAETFLFPFLIEYSLVASSLIYITWENVGKSPPPCERVIKPSVKFHNRYRGSSLGCVVMFLTVVFMILLGTSPSKTPDYEKDYFTETVQLTLYDCFLITVELLMMVVSIFGFYLFYRIRRPLEKSPLLDQILLVGCVLGPLSVNAFSLIAVISGNDNKMTMWIFTLIQPLIDTLQCILQVVFVLYGLRREPVTSISARETQDQLKSGLNEHFSSPTGHNETQGESFDNKTFIRSRRNSMTSVMLQIASVPADQEDHDNDHGRETRNELSLPNIIVSPEEDDEIENSDDTTSMPSDEEYNKKAVLKIVSESHVARPEGLRLWLRDVIMFLVIANACLWVFYSLSGTAFKVYQYQSVFFGGSSWTTITMICRPLTIFFRMHSAGCLFEMWSFA